MKAITSIVASLVVAGTVASGASAQENTMKVQKPFSVKIGGIFFSNGDTKDFLGDSTYTVGLGYDFLKTKATNPIILQAYVDYLGRKTRRISISESSIESKLDYALGLGVAARYQFFDGQSMGFTPYGFLGLGFYTARGSGNVAFGGNSEGGSSTESGVGGKIGLGAEIKQGIFGELEYNFIDIGDVNLSGFGARLGYRF
jgi:opacity protein-like surface antigen